MREDFFETIDHPSKAYWLGFLFADGNVSSLRKTGGYYVSLELAELDKVSVVSFAVAIGATQKVAISPPTGYGKQNRVRLVLGSKKMHSDLVALGCAPRKTFTAKLPALDDSMMPHFIRGYFDGDGCITRTNSGPKVDIVGNHAIINGINDWLCAKFAFPKRKVYQKNNGKNSYVVYSGKVWLNALYVLFYDNNPEEQPIYYMPRKRGRFHTELASIAHQSDRAPRGSYSTCEV